MRCLWLLALTGTLLALTGTFLAQEAAKPRHTVMYVAETQSLRSGKPGVLELHFRVVEGFHVNSHTPKSEFLLPTVVQVQAADGVTVGTPVYAPGNAFSFPANPEDKLDVYTGDFVVKLPVTAHAGEHTVAGSLRYQACDKAACYPPKTLAIEIPVTAK